MTFLLWMLIIYFFYYGGNIAFDLLRSVERAVDEESSQQTVNVVGLESVDDRQVTVKVTDDSEIDYFLDDQDKALPELPIHYSAGVSLKEIFALARSETIEFTGQVSY